jgi:hypothetical protein
MKYRYIYPFLFLFLCNGVQADNPSFSETVKWLQSKIHRYSDVYKDSSGVSRADHRYEYNENGKSEAIFSECFISSKITYYKNIDYYGAGLSRTQGFLRYKGFSLKDLYRVGMGYKDELALAGQHYYDYQADIPTIRLSFDLRGKWDHYQPVSGSEKYEWSHDDEATSTMYIYFNYDGSERDLEQRIEKAFFHLKDLALKNPNCADSKETF